MHKTTFLQKVFTRSSVALPFSLLRDKELLLPYYHTVSDRELSHIKHLYKYKTIKEFNNDLEFFLKEYKPISLHELLDHVKNGKPLPHNALFLSFDDGLSEVHEIIAPLLKKKGVPATFFVNSGFIDNKNMFYRYKAGVLINEISLLKNKNQSAHLKKILVHHHIHTKDLKEAILKISYKDKEIIDRLAKAVELNFDEYLQTNKPYLTTQQIQSLLREGFTIGAHSIDHPEYNDIFLEEQLRQTEESISAVTQKFNLPYKAFAFPFSDVGVSKSFFEQKRFQIDATFGTSGMKKDHYTNHFQRLEMEDTLFSAKAIVRSSYLKKMVQKVRGKNMIKRK